ncbi:MAG TPA: TIGR00725 family protein [Bacteroidales bacterium]|nr:TIGR00725 family protein [Bacteroidales bacterium]HRZ47969.1 TIGR00725 family protein [Bacteroidales bacterium]
MDDSILKIGIIGPGRELCSEPLYNFGVELGRQLATPGRVFVCGGLGGFMEAVCNGVKQSLHTFHGQTLGFLPGTDRNAANPYIDVAVPTGMGLARNLLIVQTAEILIAAGGGAGTLSEIAFAWQSGKKVLCITCFEGWAKELAGRNLDDRFHGLLVPVVSIEEVNEVLRQIESVS